MRRYKQKFKVTYSRIIDGEESQAYVLCDRYYIVMGKVVTETRLPNDADIISSMIIPINKIIRIMDGDIKCM